MPRILTVGELTREVKDVLEAEFPFVWVRGQVANLSRPMSGHIYFSLTDGEAVLKVVWFKSSQDQGRAAEGEAVHPLTGEVLSPAAAEFPARLEDGQEVLCAGRLNVYPPQGAYQLVAELVEARGAGDLHRAFEALKGRLADKGYFDAARKMALPEHPVRVALITSPTGAAVRDFLRLARGRGHGCELRIHPVQVQGPAAAGQIAAALDEACDQGWAEAAVLIRGGGSLEDLWAFNTETVAEAIFRARIPVVTGVGHEPDVTIADYVADLRAATPSHAAQVLWPERAALRREVRDLELSLSRAYGSLLRARGADLRSLNRALAWLSPAGRLERLIEGFALEIRGLERAWQGFAAQRRGELGLAVSGLRRAFGPERLREKSADLEARVLRLEASASAVVRARTSALDLARAGLTGLDPERPLQRGFGLVTVLRTGRFLRSPDEVRPGDELDIRVCHGRVRARTTAGEPGGVDD
ncbi:MAG: exodeoxyribonuclease VII large subunit [Desulfovibrionaceae bacterium]|nr:exodeoxyribonuclease VII large subunit [Desulfovibrionaceae bacterium]